MQDILLEGIQEHTQACVFMNIHAGGYMCLYNTLK